MTPEELKRLEETLAKGRELSNTIAQLEDGIAKATEMVGLEIMFGDRLVIRYLPPPTREWMPVCWANKLIGDRSEELRQALIEVLRKRLQELQTDFDLLTVGGPR